MKTPERPSWECGCQGDHYETNAGRAWCGDCSEWCYPGDPDMLCVRGLTSVLTRERDEAIVLMMEASTNVKSFDPLYERIRDWHIAFSIAHPDWRPPP